MPTEARRRMVRAARETLLHLRSILSPPCVIPLSRDGWVTVLRDAGVEGEESLLEAVFVDLLEAAESTPHRLAPAASDLAAAVDLVAHDLWCVQAFQPAGPDRAETLRVRLIDAALLALEVAVGDADASYLVHARVAMAYAAEELRDVTTSFSFSTDLSEAAFGIPRDELLDERGIFSRTRLLAAYYGRYEQLAIRIGTLLSVITSH